MAAAQTANLNPKHAWMDAWQALEQHVERWSGKSLTRDAIRGVSWLQIATAAGILAIMVAIVWALRQAARRKIAREAQEERATAAASSAAHPPPPSWMRLTLQEARPPFFLLLWVFAGFGAVWILVFRLPHLAVIVIAMDWIAHLATIIALFWLAYRMIGVVELELEHWAARTESKWDDIGAAVAVRALRLVTPLAAILLILPTLGLPARFHGALQALASLILIGGVGLILCRLAATAEAAVSREFSLNVADNLEMRKIQTQVGMLRKIAVALVVTVTTACMLMVFPAVRHVGTSMLASAGLAGIVLGFAAQKSLGNLIAGVQIAFTQPIRIDDVVVLENEWGRVEEINLTYVVVRIWDLRRLVLPITYFIEKPFTNWTRRGSNLLQTVFLHLDYTAPIGALREELDRILAGNPRWDGQVKAIHVTDAKAGTIEVRVLVSVADSGAGFDLCCEVREKLIAFLQRNHPGALPRTRIDLPRPTASGPLPILPSA